ncbi:HdeD family acid-resistance protein [Mycolicibacterium brumae]|uniref:HdeD family acid-resistance protein n=2 Tax=Mycolicibacterium brumae TaxID=85968 RepID=A0A2G5P764_9MYCO|nr:HdeD family acid-resistance protein [Mycolicibacterium brumae]MCV7194609.1 HdeD family acid-resistance protein [Mycolicibacterium brumae]PIB74209.1 hypothetical protein CQY22_014005 [Mycolicibacterium brumae]UWW08948.1 HdeD family acid-resistance protein [Mycolicibacterium brumae]
MTTSTPQRGTIIPELVSPLWKSSVVSGLLAIILGVIVLAWPGKTLLVTAILFGAYLLISGIAQVVFAFAIHASAGSRVLMFISGAASIVLGFLALKSFGGNESDGGLTAIMLLAIWIGVGFIFRGVATTGTAVGDPDLPGRGWAIFFGVITTLAGIVMMVAPFSSIVMLTLVVGAWLIVLGAFEIGSALALKKEAGKSPV